MCKNYLDDFLIISDSEVECKAALACLVDLVQSLGFDVNWNKVEGPAPILSFLGVEINCVNRTLSLPAKKLGGET